MMADKESTPPPAAAAIGSSPVTPAAKRVRTTSPPKETAQATTETVPAQRDGNTIADDTTVNTTWSTAGEDHVEGFDDVDDQESLHDGDSAFGTDNSDTTSVTSSIYAGYVENGRRYQTVREGEYWGPSDEKQFENMDAVHMVHRILDHAQKNQLFHSPIPKSAQNILDLGTGNGVWARDVADMFPSAVVYGIDLSPPPDEWVPPNCKFEVDDALKRWMFPQKMDLIHMRWLMGSFTPRQWSNNIYKQAYENLLPGGWIEQVEPSIVYTSDDGSLPEDSYLAGWGHMFCRIAEKIGKPLNTVDTFKAGIQDAGFINVREKTYKVPVGEWTKNPVLREAGKFDKIQLLAGMEGYAMYLLTKFGEPEPWSPQEVQVYLAKVRDDINNPKYHAYQVFRRVWAQKPLDAGSAAEKVEPVVETAA